MQMKAISVAEIIQTELYLLRRKYTQYTSLEIHTDVRFCRLGKD